MESFSKNNIMCDLSCKEKNYIISKFPNNIQTYLINLNNPLDELEILISLFSEKKVRIILIDIVDEYGYNDKIPYFHLSDIAKALKYTESNITRLLTRWNIDSLNFKDFENKNLKSNILNYTTINTNAKFITHENLKNILIKINVPDAEKYKKWLLNSSTIFRSILKGILLIRHQLEQEKLQENTNLLKQEYEKLSLENILLKDKTPLPKIKYPQGEYIYIWGIKNDCEFKVGMTTEASKRRSQLAQGNIKGEFLYLCPTHNSAILEKYIHSVLNKYRMPGSEYFKISFEACKIIVNNITTITKYIHDNIDNVEHDTEILQLNKITETINENIKEKKENDKTNKILETNKNEESNENNKNNEIIYIIKPREKPTDLTDFNLFIQERCIESVDDYVEKQTMCHAYMCWALRDLTKDNMKEFNSYMEQNYCVKAKFNEKFNCNMKVFTKIKLKDIELQTSDTDYTLFLNEMCKFGPDYSIHMEELHDEYNKWNNDKDNKLTLASEKKKFNKFLEELFYRGSVGKNGDKTSRGTRGFRGFTLKNNDSQHMNVSGKQTKKILQINAKTHEIFKSWDSLTIASNEIDLNTGSLSQDAIHNSTHDTKKIRGDYYFIYENYVKTIRKSQNTNK
jgi:prophage antirepressor-like protein